MAQFTSHLRAFFAAVPLIAWRGAAGGMPILLGLVIANRWGLAEVAAFTVANAAIAVALVIADWGATRALPRNLATLVPEGAAELLASANAFRLLVVAVMLIAGAIAAAFGFIDRGVVVYLAILFPLCPLIVVTTNALSERVVAGETRAIGTAVAAGLLVFALLGGIVLVMELGPKWFVAAYVIGKFVEAMVIASKRWWVLSVSTHSIGATAAALWPFSLQMILGVIYSRLAIFTVERMTARAELGVFSVAAALQSALLLIPASLALIHFPDLTRRAHGGDAAGVRRIIVRYTIVSGAGVALGVLFLALLAGRVDDLLNVPGPLVPFVIVFAALAFLSIFSTMCGFLMQARGDEAMAARLSVVTLSLALVYQIAALWAWGLWGIVAAVAAAELTTIAVFGAALRRPRRAGTE